MKINMYNLKQTVGFYIIRLKNRNSICGILIRFKMINLPLESKKVIDKTLLFDNVSSRS